MHRPERVLGEDELRVSLDGAREVLHRRLVGVLAAAEGRGAATDVRLPGLERGRGRRPLLHARRLDLGERNLERARIRDGELAQLLEERAVRHDDRIQGPALHALAAHLDPAGLQRGVARRPSYLAEEGHVGAKHARGGDGRLLVPGFGLGQGLQA
jgi:hypothetical protein